MNGFRMNLTYPHAFTKSNLQGTVFLLALLVPMVVWSVCSGSLRWHPSGCPYSTLDFRAFYWLRTLKLAVTEPCLHYEVPMFRGWQTFSVKGHWVNILGFAGHIQSLLYIFLLFSCSSCSGDDGWYSSFPSLSPSSSSFSSFWNYKHHSYLRAVKMNTGRIWPIGHKLPTSDLTTFSFWPWASSSSLHQF